jgi:hypothetical protein
MAATFKRYAKVVVSALQFQLGSSYLAVGEEGALGIGESAGASFAGGVGCGLRLWSFAHNTNRYFTSGTWAVQFEQKYVLPGAANEPALANRERA